MSQHDEAKPGAEETVDERLARLTRATADVRPRADFGARVVRAAQAGASTEGIWMQLPRMARWFVPAAAVMAAIGIGVAIGDADDVDDAFAVTYDQTEVDW